MADEFAIVSKSGQDAARVSRHPIYSLAITYVRVSNRKGRSMQNEFVSVVSSRPTLGKIETTPQIGYTLLEKFAKGNISLSDVFVIQFST